MELLLNQGFSSVLLIILAGLIFVTFLVTIILPALLKIVGLADVGKLKVVSSTTARTVHKFFSHPVQVGLTTFILIFLFSGIYLFYFLSRPVIILPAKAFYLVEKASVEFIRQKSLNEILKESELFLVDVRSSEEYQKTHIKGAVNVPSEKVSSGYYKVGPYGIAADKKMAVYADSADLKKARQAADELRGQGYQKVYVIKDGFGGLKKAGWETSSGFGN